jgi:hypothetical protein
METQTRTDCVEESKRGELRDEAGYTHLTALSAARNGWDASGYVPLEIGDGWLEKSMEGGIAGNVDRGGKWEGMGSERERGGFGK